MLVVVLWRFGLNKYKGNKMKKVLIFLLCTKIYAGDPCPIGFEFYNAGVATWLDEKNILDSLKSKDLWVGINYENSPKGVLITGVYDNSSAQKAGLKKSDIVLKVNDTLIKNYSDISSVIDRHTIDDKLFFYLLRDGKSINIFLTIGKEDPLFGKLRNNIHDCNDVTTMNPSKEEKKLMQEKVFSKQKRFNCKSAHNELKKLKFLHGEGGELVLARGSKRTLLSHVGSNTICVKNSEFDGKKLNEKSLEDLSIMLFSDYIDDRHRNP